MIIWQCCVHSLLHCPQVAALTAIKIRDRPIYRWQIFIGRYSPFPLYRLSAFQYRFSRYCPRYTAGCQHCQSLDRLPCLRTHCTLWCSFCITAWNGCTDWETVQAHTCQHFLQTQVDTVFSWKTICPQSYKYIWWFSFASMLFFSINVLKIEGIEYRSYISAIGHPNPSSIGIGIGPKNPYRSASK